MKILLISMAFSLFAHLTSAGDYIPPIKCKDMTTGKIVVIIARSCPTGYYQIYR